MEPKFRVGQKVKVLDETEEFEAGDILTIDSPDNPSNDDWYVSIYEYSGVYHRAIFEAVPEHLTANAVRDLVAQAQVKNGTVKRLLDEVQLLLNQL
jgi:ribosomal silencing factor RsfS